MNLWSAHIRLLLLVALTATLFAGRASAQERCISEARRSEIRADLLSGKPQNANAALGTEIVGLRKKLTDMDATAGRASATAKEQRASIATRICSILDKDGWPLAASVGSEGAEAFLYLLTVAAPLKMQGEVYPLVAAAYQKGEIKGSDVLASYVDGLRVAIGRKQLYGSLAFDAGEFLTTPPIEQPESVDKRRQAFGLPPLRTYERSLERIYRKPLIRQTHIGNSSPATAAADAPATSPNDAADTLLGTGDEVIRLETAFVSVDVIVPETGGEQQSLEKSDFRVFDDGKPVEIETFSRTDAPFDIVLLLDLSTSSRGKLGLIRRTTRRFVENKRPGDRVAVVTFHGTQTVVSELESDKAVLSKRLGDIKGTGASYVFDSIKFALDLLERSSPKERRKAVVIMSDGGDNGLSFEGSLGSKIPFADLVEEVQRSTAAIFPVYLDTSGEGMYTREFHAHARRTLQYIADQSAGNMYTAADLENVGTMYDRVLKDVGTVYTIGFSPDIDEGSAPWRSVRIEVPSRPGLKIKHRPGYFVR